ncbi:MAG: hypothetical protein ACRC37_05205 [Lentisphaeria bacterium]
MNATKNLILLVISVFILIQESNAIVIINDGHWRGEFQAQEYGFLFYSKGSWIQTWVNVGRETILTFSDDYDPVVTSVASNSLEVKYDGCGYWPLSGGADCSDIISFETRSKFISKGPLMLINNNHAIVERIQCASGNTIDPITMTFSYDNN